jgi:diguanylate cyclase (GGDEF)-like protein
MRKNLLLTAAFFIAIVAALTMVITADRMSIQAGLLSDGKTTEFILIHMALVLFILTLGLCLLRFRANAAAQLRQMEEKLRLSQEEYRIAARHSNKLIVRLDIKTKTSYRQSDTPTVLGAPAIVENIPESVISAGSVAEESIDAFRSFYDAIYRGEREGNAVISVLDRLTGEFRWYHFDFTSVFDKHNAPVESIISFYDVTLERQKELAFQRWQQSYNAMPKSTTNYFEYNLTADFFEHAEGGMLPPPPDDIPRQISDVAAYYAKHHIFRDDVKLWVEFLRRDRLFERYTNGLHTDKTVFRRLMNDTPLWTSLNIQLIPDPYTLDVKAYILLEDIDEQKKAELHLQERSTLDSLTGLLNRGAFVEKFNDMLGMSSLDTRHALIMLDIDNFKTINDTLGHSTGDTLLVSLANQLKFALRADDLCGRLGGDEFVICLKNMNMGKSLETRVSDLCNLIYDDCTWGISVSASFGIAVFPYDGTTFDELYQKADIALYKAKAQGRGSFAVYDPQLSFDDLSVPIQHV